MAAVRKTLDKQCLIYVIAGKDTPLVDAECDRLLNKLIEPQQRSTGLLNVDADRVAAAEVMDELRTLPFLTTRRVVVLKNADAFISANRELLETYFDGPSPTGVLVMTVSNFDARTRLAKALPRVGRLMSVSQPSAAQLPAKLRQYALDGYAKVLPREASELLIALAGEDLTVLYGEIDKLSVYTAERRSITADDVNALVGHNRLYNAFDVIDSMISGDAAQAVDKLRRLFAQDRTAEYTFVGAVAYHVRRMFAAEVLLQKGKPRGLVEKQLRIWHRPDAFFEQLAKVTLEQTGALLQRLAQADYQIKTGRTTARSAGEQLVMTLAAG
jgi:DNA polymerase-3 subunit delta